MKKIIMIKPVQPLSGSVCLEYARRDSQIKNKPAEEDFNRERERMKAQLLPFVKDTVKRLLKEEREYYKSRPSLAAKQFESSFPSGYFGSLVASAASRQIYAQIEERMRLEWIRKGR